MENLKDLNTIEMINTNGGIVWAPLLIKAAKALGLGVAGYLGHEVADGVVRGVAGGKYVQCR
jgi:hypothetical protein